MPITKINITQLLLIGTGGAIGASFRFGTGLLVHSKGFPYTTLLVNMLGCFLLAFLSNNPNIIRCISKKKRIAITTGLIGSFTTFSTVAIDTVLLMEANPLLGVFYLILQLVGGISFCFVGFKLATRKAGAN